MQENLLGVAVVGLSLGRRLGGSLDGLLLGLGLGGLLVLLGGTLLGGGLLSEGRLVAMSLAEKCGDTLIIHVEKALYSHQGAYPTLVQAFAAHFGGDCTYINREDDAGDQGLRTSKLQYLPEHLGG